MLRRLAPGLLLGFLLAALGAADPVRLDPPILRLDLQPSDVVVVTMILRGPSGTIASACLADCSCIKNQTLLPAIIPASGILDIRLRVTGMRPGVEDVAVATTAGMARAQIQIAGAGTGRGIDVLTAAITQASSTQGTLMGVVHGLAGAIRHCACSGGSLGSADRLATLPAHVHSLAPGLSTAWILSGDVDGKRPGVGAALSSTGWLLQDPRVVVASDPIPFLATPGVVAVIPTTPVALQHRRLLRPVLDGGLAVELLVLDAAGQIQSHHTMPVDASVPEDATFAARFPDRLTVTVNAEANPSASCVVCHASAGAAWATSRHAQALDSLKPEDRTDGCITCHVTPVEKAIVAPAVSCQSCHQGGDAHAASQGKLRTTGTTDCRSCHDAKHHPAFRRELAWPKVQHGREPAPTAP